MQKAAIIGGGVIGGRLGCPVFAPRLAGALL